MIVLDTHAWVWWAEGSEDRLSAPALDAIAAASAIQVSTWSCWEIATLVRRGRVLLNRPTTTWIAHAATARNVELVSVSREIATLAGELSDDFPGDPADRVIYATAVVRGVRLVTADRAIREFDPARTVW